MLVIKQKFPLYYFTYFWHSIIIIIIIVVIIIIILFITFVEGIYNYIPETNHVTRVHSVAAILYLSFVLHVMLFRLWNMFWTFTLALPTVCVQCPIWLFCCYCYNYYYYYYYYYYMFLAKENWPANIPWTSCICWAVLSYILYYVVIRESKMYH